MPDQDVDLIFIGIKGSVLALDRQTGATRWTTSLKRAGFVNLVRDQEVLLAVTCGIVFCLEIATGRILWQNGLSGYGYGIASIAAGDAVQNLGGLVEQQVEEARQAAAASA